MTLNQFIENQKKTQLIFDLDGTIADLVIDWTEYKNGLLDVLEKNHYPIHDEHQQLSSVDLANTLIEHFGQDVKSLVDSYSQQYENQKYKGIKVRDNIYSFFNKIQDSQNLMLWTNNQRLTVDRVLSELNLANRFQKVVSATDAPFFKPNQTVFKQQLFNKQTNLADYLMIGDSQHDERAAELCGISFFDVKNYDTTY